MGSSSKPVKLARKKFFRKARPWALGVGVVLTVVWYFSIPKVLFDVPYATVTESSSSQLLGARIASDGQWRFPNSDSVPHKFERCIVEFEDANFFYHPGVDPTAILRAIRSNWRANEIVSGASTLSMQVIRMSRNNPDRTYWEKLMEMFRATRLEAGYSKTEILNLYASHAPFGGNVVGLEAASWRYYNRPPHLLSWAETAALAVLPNNPSNIRPDKGRDEFLNKRNRLLKKLLEVGDIDSITYKLSLRESLPDAPLALPDMAHHLTERQHREFVGQRMQTDIDYGLQQRVQEAVNRHARGWRQNEVHNAAVLVMEVESGRILAYVGNTTEAESDGYEVDMLNHPRSTGSILKPLLYAEAMELGRITPYSLLADIPTRIGDFTPHNFDHKFRGAVTVTRALKESMNIPAVRTLRDVEVPFFLDKLKEMGMSDLRFTADHYGLALILGGAEVRPVQMAQAYRNWMLEQEDSMYNEWGNQVVNPYQYNADPVAVYTTLTMMEQVERPMRWKNFGKNAGRRIAWKTGTSYGFRDAWAMGTDGRWVVVAWTGNANAEGRPGVIGVQTSAPLFFEVMSMLPAGVFPEAPLDEVREVVICSKSGYKAQANCAQTTVTYTGYAGVDVCKFCERIWIDNNGLRVSAECQSSSMIDTSWMVLPPGMAWYAVQSGQAYNPLPKWNPECEPEATVSLEWIYPEFEGELVQLTRDFDGVVQPVILEAGHQTPGSTVFWSVDGKYFTQTTLEHRAELFIQPGEHVLTISDESGNSASVSITVVDL